MKNYENTCFLSHHVSRVCLCFFLICLSLPLSALAQQPTATIKDLKGTVMVSIQGQGPVTATVGLALHSGDVVETFADSEVVFLLSEGSELNFSDKTKVDISELSGTASGARRSLLRLVYGKIRAALSPGHQKEGSSFTVETPNTVAGVKFSHPEIMVSYDPATKITVVEAYTVDMVLRNLITQETVDVPKGNRGVVRQERSTVSPLRRHEASTTHGGDEESSSTAQEEEISPLDAEEESSQSREAAPILLPEEQMQAPEQSTTEIKSSSLLDSRNAIRQSTSSTVPSSIGSIGTGETQGTGVIQAETNENSEESTGETTSTESDGGGAETSTNPSPGVRPSRPDRQSKTIRVHIEN